MPPTITPQGFIDKWKRVQLTERSSCQQHFIDLCELVGYGKPAELDPHGDWFTFERGVTTTEDKQGWADVWKKGCFALEYKSKDKHKDLKAAYRQLLKYREDLENPPLLIVSDISQTEIHTNFTNTAKKIYSIPLEALAERDNLRLLQSAFRRPDDLRPDLTPENVTTTLAGLFAGIAIGMRERGVPAGRAAHFLMKLMFCMFAEGVELLEDRIFTRILDRSWARPDRLSSRLRGLFQSMSKGGDFGADPIRYFNGGLFADADVVDLTRDEIEILMEVNRCDWSSVEPSIFGTLFERILDPSKRGLVGAHYTGKDDILAVLRPVVLKPLRREWEGVKGECEELLPLIRQEAAEAQGRRRRKESPSRLAFDGKLLGFVQRLAHAKVLDPACGSGNFLYAAIHLLLELEREVLRYGASHDASILPHVSPAQLAGIEHDPYARHLAQVVVWIGYLQWKFQHGFQPDREPILDAVEGIRQADAILDLSDPADPKEPGWPEAEFIVGNPPFLGGKKLRAELGDEYVDHLFRAWSGRVKAEADLCCYWLEKARTMIEAGWCKRAGLLATQGIRGGANRETLKRINETGGIFFAESDRDWVLDGAAVHVSMIGFDDGTETDRQLNGKLAAAINNDLTAGVDVTQAHRLDANRDISFMGDTKGGKFDILEADALKMLMQPNPNGRPSSDVIVPWINGLDVTRRNRRMWIIDFGTKCIEELAALYEAPFELVRQQVYPERRKNTREAYRERWWLHVEARSGMRRVLKSLPRFIAIPRVAKHRLFVWEVAPTLPDSQLITFALPDDYHFGVLHSRIHQLWAIELGTQLETRPRYTPTTCFETFPFPRPTDGQRQVIAEAAQELDRLRNNWLNPPEWTREEVLEFPGSSDGPWGRYVQAPDPHGIGTVRYPRVVPKDEAHAAKLAARTLTNLYNERPAWLDVAHRELDEAVFAAYGWKPTMSDEEVLAALLQLNADAATRQGARAKPAVGEEQGLLLD